MAELENWQVLRGLFPSGWEQLGRSSGAVRRLRGFSSLEALLRTLLMHVGCGWSLRETAVQAKLAGIADVSDVTLLNRLRDSENWLRQLCQQLWKDNGVELQPSVHGRTVRLLDATVVREPDQTGSQWRIHYSLRLPTLECDCFDLTSTQGPNSAERFGHFRFNANELVLADAGYCHPAGIAAVVQQRADVCVRLNPYALPLWDESGNPYSLLKPLAKLRSSGQVAEWRPRPCWKPCVALCPSRFLEAGGGGADIVAEFSSPQMDRIRDAGGWVGETEAASGSARWSRTTSGHRQGIDSTSLQSIRPYTGRGVNLNDVGVREPCTRFPRDRIGDRGSHLDNRRTVFLDCNKHEIILPSPKQLKSLGGGTWKNG
jgi:hypothetical protein